MILHSVPSPEETRDRLASLLATVWAALESGLLKAREYFEVEGTEIDPWLAASITRYHARIFLEAHQHDGDYERIDLLNCGLRVVAVRDNTRFDVWIRKSDDGSMPVPQSDNMMEFCHQPVLHGFYPDPDLDTMQALALLALWEAPKNYTHITALSLSLPAQGGQSRADVSEHWNIPVPHPALGAVGSADDAGDASDGAPGEEQADDLDIEGEAEEQTGEGGEDE